MNRMTMIRQLLTKQCMKTLIACDCGQLCEEDIDPMVQKLVRHI